MTTTYWPNPRPIREFLTDSRLPLKALDSHAECVNRHLPEEFEVIGVDDAVPPQFVVRVTRDFIEATTDYRWTNGIARLTCPICGLLDGKHTKGCAA